MYMSCVYHPKRRATYPDDLLQTLPCVLESSHCEPGVRVDAHVEAHDLFVKLGQLVEVCLGRAKGHLELVVGLPQSLQWGEC